MENSAFQIILKLVKYSCNIERVDIGEFFEIVDKNKEIKDFSCTEALEKFYKDDNYTYYFNCIKGKYIVVKYENGYE